VGPFEPFESLCPLGRLPIEPLLSHTDHTDHRYLHQHIGQSLPASIRTTAALRRRLGCSTAYQPADAEDSQPARAGHGHEAGDVARCMPPIPAKRTTGTSDQKRQAPEVAAADSGPPAVQAQQAARAEGAGASEEVSEAPKNSRAANEDSALLGLQV